MLKSERHGAVLRSGYGLQDPIVNIMEQCHDMYCRDASKDLMGEFHHMYMCRHAEIGENLKRQSQNMHVNMLRSEITKWNSLTIYCIMCIHTC